MSFQPRQREAQNVGVAANSGAAFDEPVDQHVRMGSGLAPEAGARLDEADNASVALDDDGAQIVFLFAGNRFVQRRAGLGQDEPALHDVPRLFHQIEIAIALLGNAMPR